MFYEELKIKPSIQQQLGELNSAEALMRFFEMDVESQFIKQHGDKLVKQFMGNVIIRKPEDWFDYRRCLKNTYCRMQRSLLPKGGRTACRGCSSCERR
jgi:tagatose-1,6-bisphosphate aldolase non-catalytic subunit AgaZ/GatZ